ncbi:unnamed protein product [Dicrocoelium dendriticum]|nr:unnamed protein product [Dicrocoelium dendriticum]
MSIPLRILTLHLLSIPFGGVPCIPERRSDYSLPDGPYFRATIRSVSRHHNGVSASALAFPVGTVERHSTEEIELHLDLRDSWVETDLQVGDTVNILPGAEFSSIGKHITIDDSEASGSAPGTHIPAAVIHHPDTLIPGTKITGSYYCLRRSILESFWPAGDDGLDDNLLEDRQATTNYKSLMLIGSIVHELFQRLIVSTEPTVQQGRELLEVILRRPETMLQLYAHKLSSEELRTRVLSQLEKLVSWITRHLERTCDRRSHTPPMFPIIHVVTEIEENIWSSRLGIKGRIDLSALCLLPPTEARNRMISKLNTSAIDSLVLLPLELKTGRPTYSIEHKGQVLLYMMLLRDRYGPEYSHPNGQVARTADAGWLVYPQDDRELKHAAKPDPGLVAPLLPSFRGLLQARNRIAYHLHRLLQSVSETSQSSDYSCWTPRLPDVISQLRTCHMCPLQLPCSLFAADSRQFEANHIKLHTKYADACNSVTELLQLRKSHLSTTHLAFFSFWCRLVLLEHISCDRLEDLVARIVSHSSPGAGSLKNSGSIRRLKFLGSSCVSVCFQDQWHITLVPSDPNAISRSNDYGLEPGDLVVISSDDGCHIGLALGTIISLPRFNSAPCPHDDHSESQQDPFVLSSDRPLPTWVHRFRLDRYSSPKVTQLNLSNLVGLMQRSPLCDRLRSLIIDGVRPTYKNTLSKSLVAGIRRILKHLNSSQRTAILRVLMADHYVLIKGYPGTGKTETLVSLLRVFSHMKKKVLVVAHTHSAVDTLLFRLVNSGEKNVLRLGPPDRVHNQLLGYCLEEMLNHKSASIDPDDFIQNALDQAAVVGCTALAASGGATLRHAALSRTCFDLVLIDEASQLLLPTALGAILCLRALSDSGLQESQADASRFVLVGDPHQLPPLVRSSQARHGGLDRSLFHHLLDICSPSSGASSHNKTASRSASVTHTVELNLQYRMNSPIMRLANMLSYSNAIQSINSIVAESTLADVLKPPSDHAYSHNDEALPCWLRRALSPSLSDSVVLLDTKQLQICQSQYSENRKYSNKLEAQLAALLCILLVQQGLPPSDTGIITPYRNQVALVKRLLTECSEPLVTQVEVATVDQFQGRDKRAIILCLTACTKSPPSSTPDHLLEDSARLTVALTRAKHKLLIIGCCHEEFLEDDAVCLASSSVLARLFKLVHQAHGHETLQPPDLLFLKHYGCFNFIPQEPS